MGVGKLSMPTWWTGTRAQDASSGGRGRHHAMDTAVDTGTDEEEPEEGSDRRLEGVKERAAVVVARQEVETIAIVECRRGVARRGGG